MTGRKCLWIASPVRFKTREEAQSTLGKHNVLGFWIRNLTNQSGMVYEAPKDRSGRFLSPGKAPTSTALAGKNLGTNHVNFRSHFGSS